MERDELAAWLRLLETPKLGRESARRLLSSFGSPQAAVDASVQARREVVGDAAATALATPPPGLGSMIDATLAWLGDADSDTGASRRAVVTLGDPTYPAWLLDIADPPLLLYAQGMIELLTADAIAIVGSRNPTPQGEQNARAFAKNLSNANWVVVSGLALGIDGAAHEGALEGGAGTIAVVGTGLDRVYPKCHRELAHRIARDGLMLSEYALGTPPLAAHFPLRNRLIAGMTRGTLVVEAALQSGSLITARLASEAGREVFAIPGSIHSPQSRGCHALIRQGAKLVESAEDVLEELQPIASAGRRPTVEPSQAPSADPLLDAMGHDLVSLEALVARTGWPSHELNIRLLDLELSGQVARRPGQLFQRITIV
ncbi:MAG: DNA-processing protein DprA [Burkholderiaceae bacterium]|nr:DNA-processing protein DprA [Burkholderiaceae bacterium]